MMKRREMNWTRVMGELERIFRSNNTGQIGSPDETGQMEASRGIDWMYRLPRDESSRSGMTVDLLVETHGDQNQLGRFIRQLDEIIHEGADFYGGILRSAALWDGVTSITIMLEPGRLGELMIRMAVLPEVEKVEDGTYYRQESFTADSMPGATRYPINAMEPNKIRVIMKKDSIRGY
jgi:hypothetical protein